MPIWLGAITGQFDYNHFDGGTFLTTLPRQQTYLAEAGVYVAPVRLTPFLQWTNRDIAAASIGDEHRTSAGAACWWAAHNATIKAAYTNVASAGSSHQHEFTLQLQLFYF